METIIIGQENVEIHDVVDSFSSPELKLLGCDDLETFLIIGPNNLHNHQDEREQIECLSNTLRTWCTITQDSGYKPLLSEIIQVIDDKCSRPLLGCHIRNTFVKFVKDYKEIVKVPNSKICYYQNSNVVEKNIFEGYYCEEVQKSAVKQIADETRLFDTKSLKLMIDNWKKEFVNHPNIVQLFGTALADTKTFIGMEWANGGNVKKIMENAQLRRTHKHIQLVKLLRDIGGGLNWLHENGICHGNIKPSNVLLFNHVSGISAKLSDFCLRRTPEDKLWMAPEETMDQNLDDNTTLEQMKRIDIYSLGLIYYFVMSRGSQAFREGKYNHMIDEFVANNLISWMLQTCPENRPDIVQVVNHPFFWDALKNLRFLGDISRAANTTDDKKWTKIKRHIDNAYCNYFCEQRETQSFNWHSFIDRKLLKRKSRKNQSNNSSCENRNQNLSSIQIPSSNTNDKQIQTEDLEIDVKKDIYSTDSLMALIKLIRDKEQHWTDMVDGLVANFFSDDKDGFSRVKYSDYFTTKFPDVIVLVFCALSYVAPHCKSLDVLQDDYLKFYSMKDLNNGWKDESFQVFFGFFDPLKLLPEIADDA